MSLEGLSFVKMLATFEIIYTTDPLVLLFCASFSRNNVKKNYAKKVSFVFRSTKDHQKNPWKIEFFA